MCLYHRHHFKENVSLVSFQQEKVKYKFVWSFCSHQRALYSWECGCDIKARSRTELPKTKKLYVHTIHAQMTLLSETIYLSLWKSSQTCSL